MGLSQLSANGTSLASMSVAGTVSAGKFLFENQADLLIAASIVMPSVLGARIGVKIAQRLSSEVLALIYNGMSVVLIPTHFMVQKYREQNPPSVKTISTVANRSFSSLTRDSIGQLLTPPYLQHAAFGVCAGILSALMGVGGAPLTMSYVSIKNIN
jgi:hypothetical protein